MTNIFAYDIPFRSENDAQVVLGSVCWKAINKTSNPEKKKDAYKGICGTTYAVAEVWSPPERTRVGLTCPRSARDTGVTDVPNTKVLSTTDA